MHPTAIILALRGYQLCEYRTTAKLDVVNRHVLLRIKRQRAYGEAMLTRAASSRQQGWKWGQIVGATSDYTVVAWESIDQSLLDSITEEQLEELP